MFETRYRIVRDHFAGYEVQFRYWWMPFYLQGKVNTHPSLEKAKEYVKNSKYIVWKGTMQDV
jgi:hypothetical protein